MRWKSRQLLVFFLIILAVMVGAFLMNTVTRPQAKPRIGDAHGSAGSYFTIRDQAGKVILQTGVAVHKKDEFISDDNIHYVVTRVEGSNALAAIKHTAPKGASTALQLRNPLSAVTLPKPTIPSARDVVIYHTHTDESYTPTAGSPTVAWNGGIFQVGRAMSESLRRSGYSVHHSYNRHEPHDIYAYSRSRRTAAQLLKRRPAAIFDIHRDATPPSGYLTSVNGIGTSRVMIVVGRSNPNFQTNLQFARTVKGVSDQLYPGLMRGIFIGHGDYNQDLYPTALLFEVGTDTISQDLAEKAARCLSDVIIHTL